jgi:predicted acylesterase/phospholipase RssA
MATLKTSSLRRVLVALLLIGVGVEASSVGARAAPWQVQQANSLNVGLPATQSQASNTINYGYASTQVQTANPASVGQPMIPETVLTPQPPIQDYGLIYNPVDWRIRRQEAAQHTLGLQVEQLQRDELARQAQFQDYQMRMQQWQQAESQRQEKFRLAQAHEAQWNAAQKQMERALELSRLESRQRVQYQKWEQAEIQYLLQKRPRLTRRQALQAFQAALEQYYQNQYLALDRLKGRVPNELLAARRQSLQQQRQPVEQKIKDLLWRS